jgi:malonyl-CoA O-methyltransferase
MLQKHNTGDEVETICDSFDSEELWKNLQSRDIDLLFSSSAFQWSRDLKALFQRLYELNRGFSIALFSSETFKELHEQFGISSPLYSSSEIETFTEIFRSVDVSSREYSLQFNSSRELLQYIRNSGVSGGLNRVPIEVLRNFIREDRLKKLSFKVVFIRSQL